MNVIEEEKITQHSKSSQTNFKFPYTVNPSTKSNWGVQS